VSASLDAALLEGWATAAATALERHREEIDRINVFPVADRDTGTNLLLTMRSAADAARGVRGGAAPTAAALARGALLGARGNSGVILSQVFRGVAETVAAATGPCDGPALADALARGARLACAAVTRPREGTVLTVLAAAAAAAEAAGSDRLDAVAVAAAEAAAAAVRATTAQLPELARAGVVDAGGLGIYLVLDALAALAAGRPPAADVPAAAKAPGPPPAPADAGGAYEVMYLLDGCAEDGAAALRAALDGLGEDVAVVGDGATWTVHVHCADIGAALEAGLAVGRPHRVRVTPLVDADGRRFARPRAVLAVVAGPEAAALARAAGAEVIERANGEAPDDAALAAALAATGARHVTLLPCDAGLAPVAERAAVAARRGGREVVVVPTSSVVQGLAALAVHDPGRRTDDDVVAMTEAAAGTRTGALVVADAEALTWAGRCRPGDVLGLVDGEVVLIAPEPAVGALWLASRMLTAGGELVTVLLGPGVDDALGEGLAADLRRAHPEVDVVVHRGARPGCRLELGVE
jgi:DAK2 domain fusion protein YloV